MVFCHPRLTQYVHSLFGRAFFRNLGLGPGSALLAGISFALMIIYWVCSAAAYRPPSFTNSTCPLKLLLKYAHVLRKRSKYALSG